MVGWDVRSLIEVFLSNIVPDVRLEGRPGLLLAAATVSCMYCLLRNVISCKVSKEIILLLSLPIWPIPLMLVTFLVIHPFLPRVFEPYYPRIIELDFRENSIWSRVKQFHVVTSLVAWSTLHILFTRAVSKQMGWY